MARGGRIRKTGHRWGGGYGAGFNAARRRYRKYPKFKPGPKRKLKTTGRGPIMRIVEYHPELDDEDVFARRAKADDHIRREHGVQPVAMWADVNEQHDRLHGQKRADV